MELNILRDFILLIAFPYEIASNKYLTYNQF